MTLFPIGLLARNSLITRCRESRGAPPLSALGLHLLFLVTGCGAAAPFRPSTPTETTAAGSPLGQSYILVPLPNDDDALLGRVLLEVPQNGRSLDEVSRPNECVATLTPEKEGPLASTFEDGQELSVGAKARAALGAFGFEGDAQTATHFYYKLDVSKRVSQTDTTDYVACCKDKGTCGYGFVSALIYGDGEYATAVESSAQANINIPIAGGAGGYVKARVLHKRNVHGYVAALVTVTDQAKSRAMSVIGDPAAEGVTEDALPATVKTIYQNERLGITDVKSATEYTIKDGRGAAITENEFVRRFSTVTGSTELTAYDRTRGLGALAAGLAGLAAFGGGLSLFVYGTSNTCSVANDGRYISGQCSSDGKNTAGIDAALYGGGSLAVVGGVTSMFGLIGFLSGPQATDHDLFEGDAQLYVARYNRALLRKSVRDVEKAYQDSASLSTPHVPRIAVSPAVSPRFIGIVGQF